MAGNMLRRKLFRDMRREAMQFVALILLCVLGIFLFSGIDSFYLRTRDTNNAYFAQNNLADFWISLPSAERLYARSWPDLTRSRPVHSRQPLWMTAPFFTVRSEALLCSVSCWAGVSLFQNGK